MSPSCKKAWHVLRAAACDTGCLQAFLGWSSFKLCRLCDIIKAAPLLHEVLEYHFLGYTVIF